MAHALAVHAAALAVTVAGTPALRAVGPGEALEAHALAVHAAPAAVAVARTGEVRAVGASEAVLAHAAPVHAAAALAAVPGAAELAAQSNFSISISSAYWPLSHSGFRETP